MMARLLASLAAGEFSGVFKRMKVATGFYALAALLGLFGLGFLVLAGFIAASRQWGVIEASLGNLSFMAFALDSLISISFRMHAN